VVSVGSSIRARSSRPGSQRQKASFPQPTKRTRPTRNGEAIRHAGLERLDGQVQPARRPKRLLRSYGYNVGFAVVRLLRQCGDNLTREKYHEAGSHLDMELPLLLPGIRLKTSFDGPAPDQTNAGWCAF